MKQHSFNNKSTSLLLPFILMILASFIFLNTPLYSFENLENDSLSLDFPLLASKKRHKPPKTKPPKVTPLKEQPYVAINTGGQLGNQLFAVASTLAFAWDNDFKPIFPFLNEDGGNKTYNRDRIFFRLDTSYCPRPPKHFFTYHSFIYEPIPILPDLLIEGMMPCWKYFHHHRNKLLAIFSPSQDILDSLYGKYADLINATNTVSIHVRTVSRSTHEFIIPFLGLKYFEKAINKFPSETLFVVFSDRINWCEKNFIEKFPDRTFVFIDGNDHIEDLYLMSMMKHHILSNSTYSWWGAYLNPNPKKVIYVPETMYRPWLQWTAEDFYLPGWKIIPHDLLAESYPEDMYWYDEKTKSIDEKND